MTNESFKQQNSTASCNNDTGTVVPRPTGGISYNQQSITFNSVNALKVQRLDEFHQPVYIPPLAKASLKAKDEDLFPLMDKVQEFLASDRQVMLILGDSGAGKSTFNRHLEHHLWTNYDEGHYIPLFINLPVIDRPDLGMITKHLQMHDFSDNEIQEMKHRHQFILICDGYDESQPTTNLHRTNRLNQKGQWRAKMIISCRTQFLGPVYLERFAPQPTDRYSKGRSDLFQEAVITPFSKKQVEDYVARYVPLEPRPWVTEDYMRMLTTIPNLMGLASNPFLLTLALEALPAVTKDHRQELSNIKVSRVQLYDHFVDEWLGVNMRRLQESTLTGDEREMLVHMFDKGFIFLGVDYSKRLALAIFEKHGGNPLVRYVHLDHWNTWREEFFGPQCDARFLRESSPLTRTGCLFRFIHRSMLEYFFSRTVYDPYTQGDDDEFDTHPKSQSSDVQPLDASGPLFTRNLINEPSIIQFLCERVKQSLSFEKQLRAVIELSKSESDSGTATAAANAMTILVQAGVRFNGADLRGIRIPGADLSGGQFDSAQVQGADLTGVNFARSWLRQANFNGTTLEGVRFGELPYVDEVDDVFCCAYSPDGRMIALVVSGRVKIYETVTWTVLHRLMDLWTRIGVIAFSPDGQHLVSGGDDNNVRLWDVTCGSALLVMEGHKGSVSSVVFLPSGKRVASGGFDSTVRLWNLETGESIFVLQGPDLKVNSLECSADGRWLIMGGMGGLIRFWDAESGEPGAVWKHDRVGVVHVSCSPDGLWVVSAHEDGSLQLWSTADGAPGHVLEGHSESITSVSFSPNSQQIASCSFDRTVRLWDALTGAALSVFVGHTRSVFTISFSPDSSHIVSGGGDGKLRLWDVNGGVAALEKDFTDGDTVLAYSPDGRHILAGHMSGILEQRDALTGGSRKELWRNSSNVCSVALSSNAETFATGASDGTIRLWSSHPGTQEHVLERHRDAVDLLCISPCGGWIASSSKYQDFRLWDINKVKEKYRKTLPESPYQLVFSPSGHQIATLCARNTIRLYDRQSWMLRGTLRKATATINVLSFSHEEYELAIGTTNGTIYLWNIFSEKPYIRLDGGTDWIVCVSYSPCGQWLVAGSADRTIRLWRLRSTKGESRSCSAVVQRLLGRVGSIAWSPKNPLEFVTGCTDRSIRVWRVIQDEDIVRIELVWGSDIGQLFVAGAEFGFAIGLSKVNKTFLEQRKTTTGLLLRKADVMSDGEHKWSVHQDWLGDGEGIVGDSLVDDTNILGDCSDDDILWDLSGRKSHFDRSFQLESDWAWLTAAFETLCWLAVFVTVVAIMIKIEL